VVGGTAAAVSVLRRALKPRTRYAPWEKVPFGEFPRKVLVAGGGFAGYMAAKTLCDLMKGRADIGVRVISRENYFASWPMVPGIIGSEVDAPSTGHCSSGGDIRRGRERRTGNRLDRQIGRRSV
jgi:NADH dehydrogenase